MIKMSYRNTLIAFYSIMYVSIITTASLASEQINVSSHTKQINIIINPDQTEAILKPSILVSSNHPAVNIDHISFSRNAEKKYIPELMTTKEVFVHPVTIQIPVTTSLDNPVQANIHTSFMALPQTNMQESIINVSFNQPEEIALTSTSLNQQQAPSLDNSPSPHQKKSLSQSLQDLVQNTHSTWIRFLFAFLLGLLLSLTPCIYPIIPITIGILHRNQNSSLLRNFISSLCYGFGLSTTFAALGLLAAFAGASFGGLLSQPIFVIFLTIFIGYMSLTMIGIVDLKIPAFLQRNTQITYSINPFAYAYLFGLISGSIASPCVSPGLALLLTIVATMGNILAGFLLLFIFGIGMSTPLIILGTFSSSMQAMPRAGQWMVEIKKLLGFIMLATCLYYLNNILPSWAITILTIAYLFSMALFYIIDAQKEFNKGSKTLKSLLGIILLAGTIWFTFKTYTQSQALSNQISHGVAWTFDYQTAQQTAIKEHKLILLDFWANHCTICKAIDKKHFAQDLLVKALEKDFVFVKVDCTSSSNQQAQSLKNQFKVFAQPTILIINPQNQDVIQKWSSEPYNMTPEHFIKTLQNIKHLSF